MDTRSITGQALCWPQSILCTWMRLEHIGGRAVNTPTPEQRGTWGNHQSFAVPSLLFHTTLETLSMGCGEVAAGQDQKCPFLIWKQQTPRLGVEVGAP